jgi:hypothetical protein
MAGKLTAVAVAKAKGPAVLFVFALPPRRYR